MGGGGGGDRGPPPPPVSAPRADPPPPRAISPCPHPTRPHPCSSPAQHWALRAASSAAVGGRDPSAPGGGPPLAPPAGAELPAVRFLLSNGADPDAPGRGGWTPTLLAVARAPVLGPWSGAALIRSGGNPNVKTRDGSTALHALVACWLRGAPAPDASAPDAHRSAGAGGGPPGAAPPGGAASSGPLGGRNASCGAGGGAGGLLQWLLSPGGPADATLRDAAGRTAGDVVSLGCLTPAGGGVSTPDASPGLGPDDRGATDPGGVCAAAADPLDPSSSPPVDPSSSSPSDTSSSPHSDASSSPWCRYGPCGGCCLSRQLLAAAEARGGWNDRRGGARGRGAEAAAATAAGASLDPMARLRAAGGAPASSSASASAADALAASDPLARLRAGRNGGR